LQLAVDACIEALINPPEPTLLRARFYQDLVDDMRCLLFEKRRDITNTMLLSVFESAGGMTALAEAFRWCSSVALEAVGPESPTTKAVNDALLNILGLYHRMLGVQELLQSSVTALMARGPAPFQAEVFMRLLLSHVGAAIVPVWREPNLPQLSAAVTGAFVAIVTRMLEIIYTNRAPIARSHTPSRASSEQREQPVDETAVQELIDMGFAREHARIALRNIGVSSVELATEWLLSHLRELPPVGRPTATTPAATEAQSVDADVQMDENEEVFLSPLSSTYLLGCPCTCYCNVNG